MIKYRQRKKKGLKAVEKRTVIYYKDELTDEFSTAVITPKKIGDDWVYVHTSAWKRFTHFFWYRIVATPLAFLYLKLRFRHKIIGREKLKKQGRSGYFLFGNHTQDIGDALIPSMLTFPNDAYVVVHANNVSMPFLGRVNPSMGALPLPDTMKATGKFFDAMKTRLEQGRPIVIYPEAHIWPYYTKIRNFSDVAFRYPIRYGVPSYCFVNTYQKRKHGKRPMIVTYIDGPFYPDATLGGRERINKLRDDVHASMCEMAKRSNVEVIKYIKEGDADD